MKVFIISISSLFLVISSANSALSAEAPAKIQYGEPISVSQDQGLTSDASASSESQTKIPAIPFEQLLGKVVKLPGDHEIYVGAGFSPAGEKIYYGMERLDQRNSETWYTVKEKLRGANRALTGLFEELSYAISDEYDPSEGGIDNSDYLNNPSYYDALYESMTKSIKNGVSVKAYNDSGLIGLSDIMQYTKEQYRADYGTYIVYASKKPITGLFSPNKKIEGPSQLSDLEDAYADLIMIMGVRHNKIAASTTTHRGIQRNPFSTARETYKGISLQFHGFPGAVSLNYFNSKYMLVSPVPFMASLINKRVEPVKMFIGIKDCSKPEGQSIGSTLTPKEICLEILRALSRYKLASPTEKSMLRTAIGELQTKENPTVEQLKLFMNQLSDKLALIPDRHPLNTTRNPLETYMERLPESTIPQFCVNEIWPHSIDNIRSVREILYFDGVIADEKPYTIKTEALSKLYTK